MTLSGWTRLWIVAGALCLSGCEDQARQKQTQELEELIARKNEEIRLLEAIEKRLTELERDAGGKASARTPEPSKASPQVVLPDFVFDAPAKPKADKPD